MKDDIRLIAKVADSARAGLPFAEKITKPGLSALAFYTDAAGASFTMVNKTNLRAIGLLIPFLACPNEVLGKQVLFKVDTIAVLYGWYKGYIKADKHASSVLKTVFYLSALLGCTAFV